MLVVTCVQLHTQPATNHMLMLCGLWHHPSDQLGWNAAGEKKNNNIVVFSFFLAEPFCYLAGKQRCRDVVFVYCTVVRCWLLTMLFCARWFLAPLCMQMWERKDDKCCDCVGKKKKNPVVALVEFVALLPICILDVFLFFSLRLLNAQTHTDGINTHVETHS